jgi:anthranilate synthase/aminodeoxychorismate synthase-like glutamine amidotransferase
MILVLDNYDSFTYNIVQLLQGEGAAVRVVRNDALPLDEMLAASAEGVVISPGPGQPEEAGFSVPLVAARMDRPLLGVCLGHQAIAVAFGATVGRAARLMHGKTSWIRHDGRGAFAGLSDPFEATRYHSLEVREATLPAELEACAWADDGTLMGVRHRALPYWGVQFHPESVLTREGPRLIANFLARCRDFA